MQIREQERYIPDSLARETVRDGLIMDKERDKNLHLSDHLVVISTDARSGLTTYRHPITGTWRANSGDLDKPDTYIFNTAYFFYQVRANPFMSLGLPCLLGLTILI